MSDPSFVRYLTQDYLDTQRLASESPNPIPPEDGASLAPGDVGGLQIIMDAKELFAQIEPQLEASDFFSMVVSGQQGSGKSVLVRELAHLAHERGYKIIYSSSFDLVNAPEKFKELAGGSKKVCVVLDDMSYVMGALNSRQQSKTKNWFGLIRHALEGSQVLMLPIVHTTTALPPLFKNTNVWLFSKPTTMEYDYMVKFIGRNKKSRELLDRMFQSVLQIQAHAAKSKVIPLHLYGRNYTFKWGDKTDPGDGRLMLLLLNGQPYVYNSQNNYCQECKHVAFGVKVRAEDYMQQKPAEGNTPSNSGEVKQDA